MNSPIRHEDQRRVLIEWVQDYAIRACKVAIIKEDLELGNHYHKNKDEIFYLLSGGGEIELDGKRSSIKEGDKVFIPRGTRHSFWLTKGSILLGAGTEPFDPNDEIK